MTDISFTFETTVREFEDKLGTFSRDHDEALRGKDDRVRSALRETLRFAFAAGAFDPGAYDRLVVGEVTLTPDRVSVQLEGPEAIPAPVVVPDPPTAEQLRTAQERQQRVALKAAETLAGLRDPEGATLDRLKDQAGAGVEGVSV